LEMYDYFETIKTISIYVETMKNYKGKEEMVVYETPFPKEISIGEKTIKPEIISDIPRASLDRETIGIVLGNPTFWDSTIVGKPSIHENVKQVREYFHNLFGMSDHDIVPSQYWLFNDGITSNDFKTVFDPDMGYIRKKVISSLEYSEKDSLDLMVYFSGEGTTHNGEKVILPYDADSTNSNSFFPVKRLYSNLAHIQAIPEVGNVTLFMDVDFNNPSFTQSIVKQSDIVENPKKKKKKKKKKKGEPEEPINVLPKEIMPPETITVFFASNTTQLAYDHPDHSSSMFTYYLLKGLKGAADNGDKMVTVSELHNYVLKNVEDSTRTLYKDLPQIPILFTSNPDRVLYKLP